MEKTDKKESDLELINKIKQYNDEKALRTLIDRHSGICCSVYKNFGPHIAASGYFMEDLYREKELLIYNCALSYDESKKCKFPTHLYNYSRFECLNLINSQKRGNVPVTDITLEHLNSISSEDNQDSFKKETYDYVENLLEQMSDPRIKDIFEMRYFNKLNLNTDEKPTWNKIGAKLNLTAQTAINLHQKGLDLLKQKLLSKENFDSI